MNFALFGDDSAAVPLIRAIAFHPEHALTRIVSSLETSALADVMQIAPAARIVPQWEELLGDGEIDAVIVAGHEETVLDGAKRLAADGKSLLILPDARQGLAFVYELTLIRDDANVVLCPAFLNRFELPIRRLKEMIDSWRLGKVLHLQLERGPGLFPASFSPPLISRPDIDAALLADVDLLRFLAGDYNQVTALYTGAVSDGVSMVNVTLAGNGLAAASWTLKATPTESNWKLTVVGEKRTVVLSRTDDGAAFRLDADDVELAGQPSVAEQSTHNSLLVHFVSLTAGESGVSNWFDLTRACEIVDATHRSVRRRRTIDLYFENASERSVFKTQMTAVGCGLLVATFFAVLLVLVLGAIFEPSEAVMRALRFLIFLPLFVFLLLQFLVLIARPSSSEKPSSDEQPSIPSDATDTG
jgi:myo-inositol 2-dehydrogenase/D-chiro-inositol 1-dehydrogenase